jgi:hypothetical protein
MQGSAPHLAKEGSTLFGIFTTDFPVILKGV